MKAHRHGFDDSIVTETTLVSPRALEDGDDAAEETGVERWFDVDIDNSDSVIERWISIDEPVAPGTTRSDRHLANSAQPRAAIESGAEYDLHAWRQMTATTDVRPRPPPALARRPAIETKRPANAAAPRTSERHVQKNTPRNAGHTRPRDDFARRASTTLSNSVLHPLLLRKRLNAIAWVLALLAFVLAGLVVARIANASTAHDVLAKCATVSQTGRRP